MTPDLLHPTELPPRTTWIDDALCAEVGGDMWFPEKGGGTFAAVDMCRRCPVAEACLTDALAYERAGLLEVHGVWGGLTAPQRRRLIALHPRLCALCPNERAANATYCEGCGERRRGETQAAHARRVAA